MCVEITKPKMRGTKSRIGVMKTRPSSDEYGLGEADNIEVTLVNGQVHVEFDVVVCKMADVRQGKYGILYPVDHVSMDFPCCCYANQWIKDTTRKSLSDGVVNSRAV